MLIEDPIEAALARPARPESPQPEIVATRGLRDREGFAASAEGIKRRGS
jgi:hypothetical protein